MDPKYICSLLVVDDIALSRHFYESILKQEVMYDFGENVSFTAGFALQLRSHFEGLLSEKFQESKKGSLAPFELYFECTDLDAMVKHLEDTEIPFLHKVLEQPWGQRAVRVLDPDNYIVEVGESMESVVIRLNDQGLSVEEITAKTMMPEDFVRKALMRG